MTPATNTWRDIAITEHEMNLLRHLLSTLETQRMTDVDQRGALAQVIARWDGTDDTTAFGANDPRDWSVS